MDNHPRFIKGRGEKKVTQGTRKPVHALTYGGFATYLSCDGDGGDVFSPSPLRAPEPVNAHPTREPRQRASRVREVLGTC